MFGDYFCYYRNMATQKWIKEHQDKMRQYRRDYYAKNRASEKKRIYQRVKDLKVWLKEYKLTLKCIKCPETHPACLDFHHRDPTEKESNISRIVAVKGWSIEHILEEIKKCDVLCANCHRKLHYEQDLGV